MDSGLMFSVLVPTDYTPRTLQALTVAAGMVKDNGGVIHLLHVIDNGPDLKEDVIVKARVALFEYTRHHQVELGVTIIPHIVSGYIFTSIGDMAGQLGVKLIIMGVHGVQGIQFIIGSFAVRVILGSVVPVMLISSDNSIEGFKSIVLPYDANIRMEFLLEKTIEFAKQHSSTIHLYSVLSNLSYFRKKSTRSRIKAAVKQIKKAGLNCQSVIMDGDGQNISNGVLQYASSINAELIAVTMQNQNGSNEYLIGKTATQLVEKSKIPLYIVNPLKQ